MSLRESSLALRMNETLFHQCRNLVDVEMVDAMGKRKLMTFFCRCSFLSLRVLLLVDKKLESKQACIYRYEGESVVLERWVSFYQRVDNLIDSFLFGTCVW